MLSNINENIYGHSKRLSWILSQLHNRDRILEVGCGTGYMITLPLARMGHAVIGVDTDSESIAYGRKLLDKEGLNPNILQTTGLAEIDIMADVIIVSEVLEHIPTADFGGFFSSLSAKLKPDGTLLTTVPNGYGWFELESFFWYKAGLGRLIASLRIDRCIKGIKFLIFGKDAEDMTPSTLANSPHLQRFTYGSIQDLLKRNGFAVVGATGSVLFCGPFSNLFFTGIKPVMKFNALLGRLFPRAASAFYIAAKKNDGQR